MQTIATDTTKAITALKILADATRFHILELLFSSSDGLCVYEVAEAVAISHSAASHQLSKLEAHNIVESFKEGQMVCYKICNSELSNSIKKIMDTVAV